MKETAIHGGDIYNQSVEYDFSVNTNPIGIPDSMKKALIKAMDDCDKYPDIHYSKLKQCIGKMQDIPEDWIVCGNGASELFMAIVHALHPKRTLIPVPSFFGYERAAKSVNEEILYYELKREDQYCITEKFLFSLNASIDLVFLANPNNPVGNCLEIGLLLKILKTCKEKNIYLVLDECFLDFLGDKEERTLKREITKNPNLIIVRAFTKIFSIPGVRLGYLFNSDANLRRMIEANLPEWNLSTFAQYAGIAGTEELPFIARTLTYVGEEREYLTENLKDLGLKVWDSSANFLLLETELPLYEALLRKKILIRSCKNFRGLKGDFYRIAIKSHAENSILLKEIEAIKNG